MDYNIASKILIKYFSTACRMNVHDSIQHDHDFILKYK